MSFSWSTSSISSFAGMKPAPTNSFADALKRLAEHVEEKNKTSKFEMVSLHFIALYLIQLMQIIVELLRLFLFNHQSIFLIESIHPMSIIPYHRNKHYDCIHNICKKYGGRLCPQEFSQLLQFQAERREDLRRSYVRSYNGSDNTNMNLPMFNR